jgi:hypothetical protein
MKIERPTIWTPPEPVQEVDGSTSTPGVKVVDEPAKQPAELLRNPSPKTDSVEIKESANPILDNIASGPKVDPSKTSINPNEVPAALIPGVPFREKAELPKTLPNGTSVDSGVGSGDLGFGKTRPGPNHMGIDLKGNDIRNQLNDALNLKEGAGLQSSTPCASGTVNYNDLGGKRPEAPKYEAGFNRPGMGLVSAEGKKDPKNPLGLPDFDKQKKEPPAEPGGAAKVGKAIYDAGAKLLGGKTWDETWGTDDSKKYTNPDAPEGTQPPVVTEETLEKVQLRRDSTTQPGVQEDVAPIDSSKLSDVDPRLKLISNPNPEDQSTTMSGDPHVILDVKGPDTVNPRDPELGGGNTPIVIDPNRPKP